MLAIIKGFQSLFGNKDGGKTQTTLFVHDTSKKDHFSLTKMVVLTRKRRWFIPAKLEMQQAGGFSFEQMITSSVQAANAKFASLLQGISSVIFNQAKAKVGQETAKRMATVKASVEDATRTHLKTWDDASLQPFIKSDRNIFRQKLLEEVGRNAATLFKEQVRKQLGELVMRIRQQVEPDAMESSVESTGLPTGTRFAVRRGKMTIFVIENPPQTRTLKIMEDNGEKSEMYTLALPYVVFFVTLRGKKSDKIYIFFRKKTLRSLQDKLLCPGLPNIIKDYRICFSPSAAKPTLAETAEESIASYWGGRFIKTHDPNDLTTQLDLDRWNAKSKQESLYGLNYDWRSTDLTVEEMITKIKAEFGESEDEPGKAKSGPQIISAVNAVIDRLAQNLENGLKERCFNLVSSWEIDSTVLKRVSSDLQNSVAQVTSTLQESIKNEAAEMLLEVNLGEAVQKAVDETLAALSKTVIPAHAAQEMIKKQLGEANDTGSHQKS